MTETLRRRASLFLLLALAAACSRPLREDGEAGASSRDVRRHRFRVLASEAPVKVRHDLPLGEIARLPGARPGLRTQGLTLLSHALKTHTRFRTATDARKVNAWFDDVILELRLTSATIHIPREYPEGSCEYRIILLHETGHVEQGRRSVAAAARRLEDALATASGLPSSASPIATSDFASAAALLRRRVARLVDPIYEGYERSEAAAQAALDYPDPYDAVYRSCSGWK